jgi:hypothetical protein
LAMTHRERQGGPRLKLSRRLLRVDNGWLDGVVVMRERFRCQAETQVRSRPRARGLATGFAVVYELSRSLHREASWRAERLGPIRISVLQ